MDSSSTREEIDLTDDLLDFAWRSARKEARKRCWSERADIENVAGDAVMDLIRRPPRNDPASKASVKTLIYSCVQNAVIKYAAREGVKVRRFQSFSMSADDPSSPHDGPTPEQTRLHQSLTGAWPTDHEALEAAVEEILRFIDNEDSRNMCRLFLECKGNRSEVARRLNVSEGTVRNRLKLLGPKLIAAGFDPLSIGGAT